MTTSTPDRPPLWRVMKQASTDAEAAYYPFASSDRVLAAEIRALRDWLLPEQPEPQPGYRYEQRHIIWLWNQRLRAQLTAEAERAEWGDG